MSTGTSTLAEVEKLVQGIRSRLIVGGRRSRQTYSDLADAYEVEGALDLFRRFLQAGRRNDLNEAVARLDAVAARRGKARDLGLRALISTLAITARELNERERSEAASNLSVSPVRPSLASQTHSHERADLLVVGALLEPELTAFLERLDSYGQRVGSGVSGLPGVTHFRGILGRTVALGIRSDRGRHVRVACLFQDSPGLTDCAALVANAVRVFRPSVVAMTGVCAGRRGMGVRKCDLIVPRSVFTYDTGKHTDAGFQREPLWCSADPEIIRRVRAKGQSILDRLAGEIGIVSGRPTRPPRLHAEIMACGTAVVNKEGMLDEIADANRKVVGLDMESYALLRASQLSDPRIKAFVVKGVMDYATGKSDAVKRKAAFWAATFLRELIVGELWDLLIDGGGRRIGRTRTGE